MSIKPGASSSTFMPSVKIKTMKIPQMQSLPDSDLTGEPQVLSDNSASPLEQLYKTSEFRLAQQNSVRFQLARQLLYLRRFRKYSQAKVAASMGSSQSTVARIESGEENLTADTAERMVLALDGRFQVSISPQELHFPVWPVWWEMADGGIASTTPYACKGIVAQFNDGTLKVAGGWISRHNRIADTTATVSLALMGKGNIDG